MSQQDDQTDFRDPSSADTDGESDAADTHEIEEEDVVQELSLEDLGAAYARVAAERDPDAFTSPEALVAEQDGCAADPAAQDQNATVGSDVPNQNSNHQANQEQPANNLNDSGNLNDSRKGSTVHVPNQEQSDSEDDSQNDAEASTVTPERIIEAALFVGHPENKPLSEYRLASLMRDVTAEEVVQLVDRLNESYREADQALHIVRDEQGYRMSLASEVGSVRNAFLGKVREAKLNQAAIEVLSLVAYQPGVTAQKVQDQRGRESHALLNQLVRRQLLRMERKPPEEGGKKLPHYYPTERFLMLFGLASLDDLPHVEEGLRDGN